MHHAFIRSYIDLGLTQKLTEIFALKVNQINLRLYEHTKYTYANKLFKDLQKFTNDSFSYENR
jgi:hypothetical protein